MRRWKEKLSLGLAAAVTAASLYPGGLSNPRAAHAANVVETMEISTELSPVQPISSLDIRRTATADTYSILSARTANTGSSVWLRGTITYRENTGNNYSNLYIQDADAGIVVRGQNLPGEPGQTIEAGGKLEAYKKLLQVAASSSSVRIVDSGTTPPSSQQLPSADFVKDNPYEARLIRVQNVSVNEVSGDRYTMSDANGSFVIYSKSIRLQAGETYDSITGVMTRYEDTYQLIPRSLEDIVGGTPPVQQLPMVLTINEIQGTAHDSVYADQPVQQVEGIVTMVKSSSSFYMQMPDELADDDDRTSEGILVYRSGHGVKVGDQVSVDGTVKEYRETGYSDAQDLTTTEIAASGIQKLASNQKLPSPVIIGKGGRIIPDKIASSEGLVGFDPSRYSIDFYESLEGMRVQLNDATIIGPYGYELPVAVDIDDHVRRTPAGGLIITDGEFNSNRLLIGKKPKQPVKTGDQLDGPMVGIMSYNYGNFKILPEGDLPPIIDNGLQREVSALRGGEDQLTIASFNVENFWDDPKNTSKSQNIARSIIDNLHAPDIIGLMEVQDNNGAADDGTTEASQSFEGLIREIKNAGGPAYEYTSIDPQNNQDGGAPGGNIRVGFLYNPDRVSLPEAKQGKGDSVTAVTYGANGLSFNPGRIDPENNAFTASRKSLAAEFVFNDESVIVVANHFNSKGGDHGLYGAVQPPQRISEIQRAKQARVLNDFVQSVLTQNKKANIVLVGDFNDFQFSNTLSVLKGNELQNMVDTLPENERYSYVYEGNSQTLDHILMSSNLSARAELDIVHMNADFMEKDGRVSDHDPLLTRIDFAKKVDPNPDSEKDDDNKDRKKSRSNSSVVNNTGTENGTGEVAAPVQPVAPAAGSLTAQGFSAGGAVANWMLTPSASISNPADGSMISAVQLRADAARSMLAHSGNASILHIQWDTNRTEDMFRVELDAQTMQLLTGQQQINKVQLSTPLGGYELPIELLQSVNTTDNRLMLDLSSSNTVLDKARTAGYVPYASVNYHLYTLDNSGNQQSINQLDRYVNRTIPLSNIGSDSRLAVVRVEKNAAGEESYVPVPFHRNEKTVTIFSRSNSTYLVVSAAAAHLRDIEGHWAQSEVQKLADRLIVTGNAQHNYMPSSSITRAEAAALFTRTLGLSPRTGDNSSVSTQFHDVAASSWYADSIQAAAAAGLIEGDANGQFRPNGGISRQEMAVMLGRAMDFINEQSSAHSVQAADFGDSVHIAGWAKSAIDRAHAAGLLHGDTEGKFQPLQTLSRAESAAVMSRLLDLFAETNEAV